MDLTEKVLQYQRGNCDWNDIWADLEWRIHEMIGKKLPDESTRSDLIDAMNERFKRMAQRFEYQGKDFLALVYRSVQFQVRSFKNQQARRAALNKRYELLTIQREAERQADPDSRSPRLPAPRFDMMHPDAVEFASLPVETRRVLLAAFRNSHVLTDRHLLILARRFKLSFDWLFCIREEMKDSIFAKLEQVRHAQSSIEAIQVREQAGLSADETTRRIPLEVQPSCLIPRLRQRLARMHPYPQQAVMSACLKVPAGTISSALSQLRLRGLSHK